MFSTEEEEAVGLEARIRVIQPQAYKCHQCWRKRERDSPQEPLEAAWTCLHDDFSPGKGF